MANLVTITLIGPSGGYFITDPRLAYANVITVKRGGQRYYQYDNTGINFLSGPVCFHDSVAGRILFAKTNKFDTVNPETVHVIINQV